MADVIKRSNHEKDLWKLPPTRFGTKSRERVNGLVAAKTAHFRSERDMKTKLETSKEPLMCDIDCSERYERSSTNGIAWTLTASRAASGGPFLVRESRRTDLPEMSWVQGIDFVKDGVAAGPEQLPEIKPRTYGHMLGNATTLSVTERVMRNVLISIGFIDENHRDRWSDATLEAGPAKKRARTS